MGSVVDQRLRDIQREYLEFLEDEQESGVYMQNVREMITAGETRLEININDLRKSNPQRVAGLMSSAFEEIPALHRALKELVAAVDSKYAEANRDLFVGFKGSFGSKHVSPRTLSARNLGNLVCVEGIVTKCSLVRPKVVESVHYCPATKKFKSQYYTDMTSYEAYPSTAVYPTKDEDGNLLETEFGLSVYKDHQTITIQEMPEKSPAGQLPRSIDVILDNDLVDKCKPGDRLQIVGIYRCLPNKQGGFTSGTFRTILLANNVILLSKEVLPDIDSQDVKKCQKFSKTKKMDVFEVLAKSLAPSIHGHAYIKKALLCMLLGGMEKHLPNGTRLRGDINILLIGDPSVAKSQLLRYVLHTAPRAITTTGRGSSGVGLTAAVTTDQETGERRLEAGAMVLGDRGVVCIDEFDKMSDMDRTAIHEVMEQGRVTISKAGIHASLNARCSVLAAANPVYGRYDSYKTPMENIGLQDSLLSRFDCLFIMLDTAEPNTDRMIADHVVRMHRYRAANEQDGEALPMGLGVELLSTDDPTVDESTATNETPIYEKYDPLLHGKSRSKDEKVVSLKFMRKYIHIAKRVKPVLTKEASEAIAEEYSRLRSQDTEHTDMARTQPVTARALETLIRLSTAHAKARLSNKVEVQDAEAAIEMVQYAYFKKVIQKTRRTEDDDEEAATGAGSGSEAERREDSSTAVDTDSTSSSAAASSSTDKKRKRDVTDSQSTAKKQRAVPSDPYEIDDEASSAALPSRPAAISVTRLEAFSASVSKLFQESYSQSVTIEKLKAYISTKHSAQPFTEEETEAALAKLSDQNKIMVADDLVFLI